MIKQLAYQSAAVDELVAKCLKLLKQNGTGKKLVFKAPTGAGKTVMASLLLEKLVAEMPANGFSEPAFIWIAPNQLHEQSCRAMRKLFSASMRLAPKAFEEINHSSGGYIAPREILFLNWQKINSRDNILTRENEQGSSLYDIVRRTREEHYIPLIAIIDEEHLFANARNATRSIEVLNKLAPKVEIRISATPTTQNPDEMVNIPREEVITAQMIKEGITINPALPPDEGYGANITLLRAALKKRTEIKKAYAKLGVDINPLLLVQMPNDSGEKLSSEEKRIRDEVVEYLEAQEGITAENGRLAVWLSEEKSNLKGIERFDSLTDVLIFKQAIAMGWDCPRAAILLIFRDIKSQTFTMQTVGRILRMPQQKFYAESILNRGYVYTNLARDMIQIVRDDINYITHSIVAMRREGLANVQLTSTVAGRPSQIAHTRLGSDFSAVLFDTFNSDWFKRPIQMCLPIAAFTDENSATGATQLDLSGAIERNIKGAESAGVNFGVSNVKIEIPINVDITGELETVQVDAAHRSRIARTASEIERIYEQFCLTALGADFEKSTAVPKLKGDLLQLMEDALGKYENDARRIILAPHNRELFSAEVRKALETYLAKIKAKRNANKARSFSSYEWEIPDRREYSEDSSRIDNKAASYAMEPCVLGNSASHPEQQFEEYLSDNSTDIDWWYKNGDNGRENFAVPYTRSDNEQALFYVDYVIRTKKGEVYLFDTKTAASDSEAANKHNALLDYIDRERTKGRELHGGILIFDKGLWRYSKARITGTTNLSGWVAFVP